MKGVVLLGDRRAAVRDFADPDPGHGEVRVAMRETGICGSDLHVYRRSAQELSGSAHRIPGHEPSGVVDAVGPGVERVQIGDRVCVNHYRSCGYCRQCAAGKFQWCRSARGYGGPVDGSHADYILADERNCVSLPHSVSFADGAFVACAGGTAYAALRKLDVSVGDSLVVFGLGPVGLSGVLVGKAMGARVVGVDVIAERVELARRIGADTALQADGADLVSRIAEACGPEGPGHAFEASGSSEGRRNAVACLRRGGKAVFCGVGSVEATLNPTEIISRELVLMGSFVLSLPLSYELVSFLEQRRVSFESLVTHRFPITDGAEAYRVADESKTGKVLLVSS
ncbi:zinc-binding dehydrogenase [Candidatus Poribacteria bacterium]|nr:zinc-binding dehydrogenase [Candidatus Poribacteria bacterium]